MAVASDDPNRQWISGELLPASIQGWRPEML